jgi:hypothetical protein
MCALCGAFGIAEHWTDDAGARPAAATRQHRAAIANQFLSLYGLTLAEWADRFTLTSRTGGALVVDNFGALWPAAEKLAGPACDPLDPAVLERLEQAGACR